MSEETRVLYNESCPVCRYEIHHYRDYAEASALPIRFDDISGDLSAWGVTPDAAARRLHVLKNGELLAGIPAFIALWQDMPRYRWLARVTNLPVIKPLACLIYDYVLALIIYKWHLRRQARLST